MDDRQIVHRIEIINEHMVEVFHNFQEVCNPVQTNVNIFIACFTTSYAWLKLYDALDTLKERVLYMDTGSIIYTKKPTETSIPVGNYLGEFEFVAAEPKNYTYNTFQGKQTCKVRGFTLNERGQKILNFKSMRDLVLKEILQPEADQCTLTLQNPHKITRYAAKKKPSKQYRKTKSTKSFLTNVSSTTTPFNHFPTAINVSPHLDFQPQHHEWNWSWSLLL